MQNSGSQAQSSPSPSTGAIADRRHPRGLATLFFTEMWERFSYYGMRALLVLFMVDAVRGGMALDDKTATAIYGLYTAAVYLMSLPGGWLADRLWGAQRAVWIGGIVITLGHFTLALPWRQTFYLGLVLVVIGSGVLNTPQGPRRMLITVGRGRDGQYRQPPWFALWDSYDGAMKWYREDN